MLRSSVSCLVGALDGCCQQELIRRWLWSLWEGHVAEGHFPNLLTHPHHPGQSTLAGRGTCPSSTAWTISEQHEANHLTFPAWRKLCVPSAARSTTGFVLLSCILSQVPEADPWHAFPAFGFQMRWGVRRIQAKFALRRCSTALTCSPRRAALREHSSLTVTVCKL